MSIYSIIELVAMLVLMFYVVICIVDSIYDAVHARKADRRLRKNDVSKVQS